MREIGGYLELDQLINKPYHQNMLELNTARNALLYLINTKNIQKVYLPHYMCDSVYMTLENNKIDFEFYHIDKYFSPIFEGRLQDNHYLYLVNYFGQLNSTCIEEIQNNYKNIILDNTQNFFQKPINGIDTLYSCRKYLGVPDGAYLATTETTNKELAIDFSGSRLAHLVGRYEGRASEFYTEFKKTGEILDNLPIRAMSKLTKNLLGAIDYDYIFKKRNVNFNYLHEHFINKNVLKVRPVSGAFSYPLYVQNGIEVRKKLAARYIYIPTLWPNVLEEADCKSIEYDYAANILPLPCDQRYGIQDMKRLVKEVEECIN